MLKEKSGCGPDDVVTVQEPSCAQPLSSVAFWASMNTPLAPTNAGLKVSAKLTIRVLPDIPDDDAPASRMHWLFCAVPATPMVRELPKEPASLAREIALLPRL